MAKVGRPPKFKSARKLQVKIDEYFKDCKDNDIPLTVTGLGLAIELSRQQLIEYSHRDEFHDTIKKAKQTVEMDYELALRKNGRAGEIFGLKNMGWKDKSEVKTDNTTTVKHGLTPELLDKINEIAG